VNTGDLVYDKTCDSYGIILSWLSLGGSGPTFWEIFYEGGKIDGAFEDELEVVNENR